MSTCTWLEQKPRGLATAIPSQSHTKRRLRGANNSEQAAPEAACAEEAAGGDGAATAGAALGQLQLRRATPCVAPRTGEGRVWGHRATVSTRSGASRRCCAAGCSS